MKRTLAILLMLALLLGMAPLGMATEGEAKAVFQMNAEPTRMDPTMNDYANGSYALQNLFRGLYKYAEDGTITEALAESHDLSEDGTVYTFHLREGLMWSDGDPLTAHDFVYSWKRVLDPDMASEGAYAIYDIIKDGKACYVDGTVAAEDLPIRALDDLTLEVELAAPTPYFLSMTASTILFPVKQGAVESHPDDPHAWEWDDAVYVSSGPYRLKEMRRDEKFIFEKNPYYYNADEVKLDVLEFVFLTASETALLAFDNGDVDVASSVNADAMKKYQDTDNLMITDRIGYRWYEFRTDRAPFDDARVRQALAMAIDRRVITEAVMQTNEEPLLGFVPNGFPDLLDPTKEWRETHDDVFAEDVEAAQALLAEAGFPGGEGFPSFRLVQESSTTLELVAQALAQMWKQNLGIDAEIQVVESGIYWADDTGTRKAGDFEVCYMGYTGDYLDPLSVLNSFVSTDNDATQWENAEYDALIATLKSGVSGEERQRTVEACERVLGEEMPVFPVYNYTSMALVGDRIGGFVRNYVGHPNFEYAYIK